MNYQEREAMYTNRGITNFKLRNAEDVEAIIGFNIKSVRGYRGLSDEDKTVVEDLIVNFLNGWGLEAREDKKATNITREAKYKRFKVSFGKDGYSYLYDNGSIG